MHYRHERKASAGRMDWYAVGYSFDRSEQGRAQKIVINEKGKLIAKAFAWKIQGHSNTDIADKLAKSGFKVDKKRLSEILRNPFYCGYLSHNLLEGQVIKGNHEALITEEAFLQANEMLKKNAQGYKQESKNSNVPLKNFVRCAECGTPFTGYIVKAKNLYYYKCNKIGCKCNRSAKGMHSLYADFLKCYQIDQESCGLLKEQLLMTYEYLTQSEKESLATSQQKLNELQNKLNKIEERFAYGEIDRDLFEKIAGKLKEDIRFLNGDSKPSKKNYRTHPSS